MKKRSIVLTSCLVKPKPITGPKRMEKLKMIMNEGRPKVILLIIIAMTRLKDYQDWPFSFEESVFLPTEESL